MKETLTWLNCFNAVTDYIYHILPAYIFFMSIFMKYLSMPHQELSHYVSPSVFLLLFRFYMLTLLAKILRFFLSPFLKVELMKKHLVMIVSFHSICYLCSAIVLHWPFCTNSRGKNVNISLPGVQFILRSVHEI